MCNLLYVPDQKKRRFTELVNLGTQIASFASTGDAHLYKMAAMGLASLANRLKNPFSLQATLIGEDAAEAEAVDSGACEVPFLPPVARGGKLTKEVMINRSKMMCQAVMDKSDKSKNKRIKHQHAVTQDTVIETTFTENE